MNMLRNFLALATAALLIMALSSNAAAQDSKDTKVGVAVSAVINGSPGIGTEVSEALGAALATMLKAEVIAGNNSQSRLPQAAQSETCLGDSACLVAAGKALGVDQLLMLIIIDSAQEVKVEATWVDVATGTTALRPAISASKSSDNMADHFLANAASLLPDIELRPQENNDLVVPPDNSVDNGSGFVTTGPVGPTPEGPGGRHFTSLSGGLAIGGGVLLGAGLGIAGYLASQCGFNKCDEEEGDQGALPAVADVTIGFGAAALVGAGVMYLLSDSGKESAPVALSLSGESVAFSYGGSF